MTSSFSVVRLGLQAGKAPPCERKVSFSQETSFVHHFLGFLQPKPCFCSQAELIISHVFVSFCGMEEGGQDSERTRAMRQGEAKNMLKCKVGKHLFV